jgi:hypothetical protein
MTGDRRAVGRYICVLFKLNQKRKLSDKILNSTLSFLSFRGLIKFKYKKFRRENSRGLPICLKFICELGCD